MKVALTGYYGMSNYGDDLFSIISYCGAKRYWSKNINLDLKILSPSINHFNANYAVPDFLASSYQLDNILGSFTRVAYQALNFTLANKVIFAGGSLFTSGKFSSKDLTTCNNNNLWAIGVSVGPFRSTIDERKVVNYLKKFEYISTRDIESFDYLNSLNIDAKIVSSSDLAGLGNKLFAIDKKPPSSSMNQIFIGFSPCYVPGNPSISQFYCDTFLRFVKQIKSERDIFVDVICLNQHAQVGDLNLCNYVTRKLIELDIKNRLIKYKDIGVLNTWSHISTLDFYVSVRLHGSISAFMNDVRFFCFEPNLKTILNDFFYFFCDFWVCF
jgi:hypothetical protein